MPKLNLPGSFDLEQWVLDNFIHSAQDIAFVSGSHVEGFSNPRSDTDVFVVHDSHPYETGTLDIPTHDSVIAFIEPYYVDVEEYTLKQMQALSARINLLYLDDFDSIRSIPPQDLDLYYRTTIGRPIVNSQAFQLLQANFQHETISGVFHVWAGLQSVAEIEKAQDVLRSGNRVSAFYCARAAIEWAVDSFLAAHGESFPPKKWRFEKLRRRFGESSRVYTRAWELKSIGTSSLESYIENGNQFCHELGMSKFALPASYPNAPEVSIPRRGSQSQLFAIGNESYIIQNRLAVYEINRAGRFIWEHMDGSTTLDTIATLFAKEFDIGLVETHQCVTKYVNMLSDYGLVRTGKIETGGSRMRTLAKKSDLAPLVTKIPQLASEFAISKYNELVALISNNVFLIDVAGGIQANHLGLVVLQSRIIIEGWIDAFLALSGAYVRPGEDRFEVLARAIGKSSQLYLKAWSLEVDNPITPEEVIEHAIKCVNFVEDHLNINWDTKVISRAGKEEYELRQRCWDIFSDLENLFTFLGIPSPNPKTREEKEKQRQKTILGQEISLLRAV